ncbi:MAG TPA: class I SAM-dependent methyltransferase [Ktedonobacterales bacterium]
MGWFRRHRGDDGHSSDSDDHSADSSELFLPGAVGDSSLNEGPGFVLLGGPRKEAGDIPTVLVDEEGVKYITVGGRRLLATVPDVLPKDAREIRRLDFEHYLLRGALRANHAAPVQQPAAILDVGCGSGRWANEIALQFPHANVIGLDVIAPPALESAPAENYVFVQGNVLQSMPFGNGTFDFVHMRLLFMAIPTNAWPVVTHELARVTRYGGWVELVESGLPIRGGPALDELARWVGDLSLRRGIDLRLGARIAGFLHDAQLGNITFREFYLPLGRYGGRFGQMAAADMLAIYDGLRPLVIAEGIADPQSYDRALAQARGELEVTQQCVRPFYLAFGQRM